MNQKLAIPALMILTPLLLAGCTLSAGTTPAAGHSTSQTRTHGAGMGMSMEMATIHSEAQYLADMVPHHEEAIVAAQRLLTASARPEMRAFAQSIITNQGAEIVQMRAWLARWYPDQPASAYQPMMRDLSALSGDALDRAFLDDMPHHHMMAVMMSFDLTGGNLIQHAEVRPFADRIALTQRAEIQQMFAWNAQWFGVSNPMGGGQH